MLIDLMGWSGCSGWKYRRSADAVLDARERSCQKPIALSRIPLLSRLVATVVLTTLSDFISPHPPTLFANPEFQSPIFGRPGDIIFIPGDGLSKGDRVVYQALIEDTIEPMRHPVSPQYNDVTTGYATPISYNDIPHSISVQLPLAINPNQPYALWVLTKSGEWSNGIEINESRPMWFSPSSISTNIFAPGNLRSIKVIGRNLRLRQNSVPLLHLVNEDRTIALSAAIPPQSMALARSAVEFPITKSIPVGRYWVEYRDGDPTWKRVSHQMLIVRQWHESPRLRLDAPQFGRCQPDDGIDDTPCFIAAIEAASSLDGGATVFLPRGTWNLIDARAKGVRIGDGLVLPAKVNLLGAGASQTRIVRSALWRSNSTNALFTLSGNNRVSGITFIDERRYTKDDPPSPAIQLGVTYYRNHGSVAPVDEVSIFDNVFVTPRIAIADGGSSVSRLLISHNEFGAYLNALSLAGNRRNPSNPFSLDDSQISDNIFRPGSYIDIPETQGSIATILGASRRLDFSGNTADGSSAKYLYDPHDATGWRAAFFWHLHGSHEQALISQNAISCAGDKIGDGEAIALDNNANTFGFQRPAPVVATGLNYIVVSGRLSDIQEGHKVDAKRYYAGHWVQVVSGKGMGQTRKISSYNIDAANSTLRLIVTPNWDVIPSTSSQVTIGKEFWQTYIIDNVIDNRRPLCMKSNRSRQSGGKIAIWGQTSDSLVAGNHQYDTDGIVVQQRYKGPDPTCNACKGETLFQSFLQILGNHITGQYNQNSDCSESGIILSHSASPTPDSPPPVLSYGLLISDNDISNADSRRGGSISTDVTWYRGPFPHKWPLINNMIVQRNTITGIIQPPPKPQCQRTPRARIGINIASSSLVWNSIFFDNICHNATEPLHDGGNNSIRVCRPDASSTCACPDTSSVESLH